MKKLPVIKKTSSLSPLGPDSFTILNNVQQKHHFLSPQIFNGKSFMTGSLDEGSEKMLRNFSGKYKKFTKTDRTVVMAAVAAENLLLQNPISNFNLEKTCLSIGSSRGATGLWEDTYEAYINNPQNSVPLLTSPLTTMAHISTAVAAHLNTGGINIENSTTCSTGLQSLFNAILWLRSGFCDTAIAGASEAPLTPFTLAQVEALKLYSKGNTEMPFPCMPLAHKTNNTFVLGEAASLALLKLENIKSIHVKNDIVIESFGFAFDAPPSLTGIDEEGVIFQKAIKMALKKQITKAPVDMVLTHMPGTVKGDLAELKALRHVFGNNLPYIYSSKWQSGHTYASSAMLNIDLGMLCINNSFYPVFPYELMIANTIPSKKCRKVMINAAGFGGNSASIILSCPTLF